MKIRHSLVVGILVLSGLACSRVPPRPANVPAESFYVGKRRDGVFVQVVSKEIIGWRLKIYGRDGSLKGEGLYVLRGMARAELLPEELVSFDGEAFRLSDGGLLVPRR